MTQVHSLITTLRELPGDSDLAAIATYVGHYIDDSWQPVLRDNRVRLLHTFEVAGEAAYAAYWGLLTKPLRNEFARAGLSTLPAFPGDLNHSVEADGPPASRNRSMWYVVRRTEGDLSLGTLVLNLVHDHKRFRVPRVPQVMSLTVTSRPAILRALFAD
ncbi:MAG: hypothetical protein JF888_13250 [Candidatus Dormibacteraeota bacterium]|uniref:Uncharacterized protein n=1 Tax=Candidatus Dormiibacter inghamiae TaxID=3127013 RepID=A0A934KEN1_9BACT|nr:hypothetical protein [Candidatus Dormibacteraeota bacterium]MBJ7606443.1 hypothetical protein [Candidatus Dormibacteraeota bacterium]